MSKQTWVHWVAAAILVVVAGVLIASAEERIEVKVLKESADAISVDVNGVTEVVRLEDLADGESRIFDVGDHELVVKRVGGDLTIVSDGHGLGSFDGHGKSLDTMVWVGEDGEDIEIDCDGGKHQAKKIVVMTTGDQEAGEAKTYTIHVDGDEVLLDGEVDHPMIVKTHEMFGNVVKYRCEETGSVLLVKKEDALQDTYICPATGCVMTKVEEPEVRVIKIEKRVESDE